MNCHRYIHGDGINISHVLILSVHKENSTEPRCTHSSSMSSIDTGCLRRCCSLASGTAVGWWWCWFGLHGFVRLSCLIFWCNTTSTSNNRTSKIEKIHALVSREDYLLVVPGFYWLVFSCCQTFASGGGGRSEGEKHNLSNYFVWKCLIPFFSAGATSFGGMPISAKTLSYRDISAYVTVRVYGGNHWFCRNPRKISMVPNHPSHSSQLGRPRKSQFLVSKWNRWSYLDLAAEVIFVLHGDDLLKRTIFRRFHNKIATFTSFC